MVQPQTKGLDETQDAMQAMVTRLKGYDGTVAPELDTLRCAGGAPPLLP